MAWGAFQPIEGALEEEIRIGRGQGAPMGWFADIFFISREERLDEGLSYVACFGDAFHLDGDGKEDAKFHGGENRCEAVRRIPRTTIRYFALSGLPCASFLIFEMAMVGRALPTMGRRTLYWSSEIYSQVLVCSWRPRYSSA